MKALTILLSFLIIFPFDSLDATVADTTKNHSLFKKSIIPAALITTGVMLNGSQFEKDLHGELRDIVGHTYEYRIDDYIQYLPIAEMYIADIAGVKSKNHWFDQTKYWLISFTVSYGITRGLKRLTGKTRPDGNVHSFPYGHTNFAFTNATVLYNEFNDTSPLLAYSGYFLAATTGAFRMLNNRHWLPDVLAGAGIGILVTQMVYHFEPLKNFNPFLKTKDMVLMPQAGNGLYGLYFSLNL